MDHGTGIVKKWYEDGQLEYETSYIQGQECGRSRIWYEDGELTITEYFIRNRRVSKKKYLEACRSDLTLPRYDEGASETEPPKSIAKYVKREASEAEGRRHNEFINKFLKQPNHSEARQWLADDEIRNIGEMTPEESREYISEGYKAGAAKIIAVEIQGGSTNCLIVYLPRSGSKRKRVFEWNGESAQECGFDPYDDWGQNELFVYFS
jgi:hypothetical protein